MRQLLPQPLDEVDVAAAYAGERPAHDGRPWVVALMVSTADGAAVVEGRSGAIGGPGDGQVFAAVRAIADAVLVGAGTVAAERYGPVRLPDEIVALRHVRGQASQPQLAVVSGRLSMDPDLPVLTPGAGSSRRPLLIHSPTAPAERRAALAARAELVEAAGGPGGGVDPSALLAELHRRGHRVVVLEGGPTLNGTMVAADLVDELCLTLDPMVVGGRAPRIVVGAGPGAARAWRPAHLLEHDGALFWRVLRDRTEG